MKPSFGQFDRGALFLAIQSPPANGTVINLAQPVQGERDDELCNFITICCKLYIENKC